MRLTPRDIADLLKQLPASLRKAFIEWLEREPEAAIREPDLPKASDFDERRARLRSDLPMGYTLVAQSRDGRLCLYQDKDGHLAAVDSDKFV